MCAFKLWLLITRDVVLCYTQVSGGWDSLNLGCKELGLQGDLGSCFPTPVSGAIFSLHYRHQNPIHLDVCRFMILTIGFWWDLLVAVRESAPKKFGGFSS